MATDKHGFLVRTDRKKGGRPRWKVNMFDCKPGERFLLVLLNKDFDWFDMHWGGLCHVPHVEKPGGCPHCNRGSPYTPQLFISAAPAGGGATGILQITYRMWDSERRLQQYPSLRGVEVEISRPGKHICSPRYLRLDGYRPDSSKLPPALDIQRFVEQMYAGVVVDGAPEKTEVAR